MALYLLLGADDPSSSATLLTSGGEVIDDLAAAVKDLGGTLHSLAATSGAFTVAGFVDLPDSAAAVALALTQACFGRDLTLTPAVPAHEWPALIAAAKKITMLSAKPVPTREDGAPE